MIRSLKAYVNDDGVKIEYIEPASEDDRLEFKYFGVAQMVTSFGQSEVRFVIPASSLEEAFSKYEPELNKFSEEMKKQFQARAEQAEKMKKQAEESSSNNASSEVSQSVINA